MKAPDVIKNYFLITKPGIVLGNLISTLAGFALASRGRIDVSVLLPTLIGTSLVIASACVFNNCADRKLDRKMIRTCNRVLAKDLISTKAAVWYASILGIAGMVLLWAATNPISAVIVMIGFAVYAGLYSLYLKRRSAYGMLIGSLAGTAPPLAGYCAVSNRVDIGAVILFFVFGLWQMPHCYAITIYRYDDYVAAGLPVPHDRQNTRTIKKYIVGYIVAFIGFMLMLTFSGYAGYGTLTATMVLGFSWLILAWSDKKFSDERIWAKNLYVFSILTIFGLSVVMSMDSPVPKGFHMLLG